MSVDRYRTSGTSLISRAWWQHQNPPGYNPSFWNVYVPGFDYSTTWPGYYFSSFDTARQLSTSSGLTDQKCSPGELSRSFHPCTHVTGCASIVSGDYSFRWNTAPNLYHYVQVLVPVMAYNITPPNIAWGPLVSDLGSLVRDRLSNGSLLLVTVKELGKTVSMLRNPFNLMRTNWRSIVGKKTIAQLAQKPASLWLEYQYGWKSLYADIKSFSKAFARMESHYAELALDLTSTRFSKRAEIALPVPGNKAICWSHSFTDSWIAQNWGPGLSSDHGAGGVAFLWGSAIATVGCRRKLGVDTFMNRLKYAQRQLGCSTADLLPTLWEIVPYSFVVDWFVNLQGLCGYLGACRLLTSANCSELGYSIKEEYRYRGYFYPDSYLCGTGYGNIYDKQAKQSATEGIYTRYTRSPGLPATNLSDFCGTDLSVTQLVSGAGLIIQRLTH